MLFLHERSYNDISECDLYWVGKLNTVYITAPVFTRLDETLTSLGKKITKDNDKDSMHGTEGEKYYIA